jgi:uncharacterized protein (TIGR04562 family)
MPTVYDMSDINPIALQEPVYHFPWKVLDAIVAGRSAIDLGGMRMATHQETLNFIEAYGFDPYDPEDQNEMDLIFQQTVGFISETLLPFRGLDFIPLELPKTFPEMMLLASNKTHGLRDWACAFLRVAHAVAHARFSQDVRVLALARTQVFNRFSTHLKVGADGMMVSDGEIQIPLVRYDFKNAKPWESLVLKLLHKADNVAQEVYDHLGVRFVTPDKAYALLLLKYFRFHHVFAFANIKPSRSINTLVDLDDFKLNFDRLDEAYLDGEISFRQFTQAVHKLGKNPISNDPKNPYTNLNYQTMQFTARTLVKTGPQSRAFIPFEVQIMDKEAYESSLSGQATHEAYRARQKEAVCARVFPWLAEI